VVVVVVVVGLEKFSFLGKSDKGERVYD